MKLTTVRLLKGIGAAAILAGTNMAMAAETVTVPASVTVNNAIDFTFTGELNFGTMRAEAGAVGECAILTLPANPASPIAAGATTGANDLSACSTANASASLQSVSGTPTRPVFTLAGLPNFTVLTLTLPSAAIELTGTGLPPGSSRFLVGNFTAYQTSAPTGALTTSVTIGGTGGATFTVGAQIATDPVVATGLGVGYQDGIA